MKKNLAPIVLFVYNRPRHTEQTLEALCKNDLASESLLYIYADGPKENASEEDLQRIIDTRAVLTKKQWCKEVNVIKAESNKGLSASIIYGTTEIVEKYGKVITIEDDVIVTKFFLDFMNEALELYEKNDKVWMISGFYWPVKITDENNSCFFLPVSTTQAWGTWKRSWKKFDVLAKGYEKLKTSPGLRKKFNMTGSYDFTGMLIKQMETDLIDSWAIRFWWSMFKGNGLNLYPDKSLISNIGYDGSGVHCSSTSQYHDEKWDENYTVTNFPKQIRVSNKNYMAVKLFHEDLKKVYKEKITVKGRIINRIQKTKSIALKLKSFAKPAIRRFNKSSAIKSRIIEAPMISDAEHLRLRTTERFVPTETEMWGNKIIVPDSNTFLSSLNEIFIEEIYKFNPGKTNEINMIDCGANIGLASIYLKRMFPTAHIVAFEADPNIFNAMQSNFLSFGFSDVQAINAAVSDNDGTINFHMEGGHSGMISNDASEVNITKVNAVRLKTFLQQYQQITFLKIDIEGHEINVLPDIKEELKKVEFLFLEYHSFVDQEQQLDSMLQIIKDAGFKYYLREATHKKDPFITRQIFLGMDLLVNIFCYRDE